MDRRGELFSETHGDTGFGDYNYFKFDATAQNIRIERQEKRDLAQDFADIAEGIKTVHASDHAKRLADEKRERKMKRREAKMRKKEAHYFRYAL